MQSILSLRGILFLVFNSLVLVSCNDPDLIGLDLQPESDQVGITRTDTFTIETYTRPEDSLITSRTDAPLFLGTINDPVYTGSSDAGFVIQARIGNTITPTTFDNATTPDSIILSFAYRGVAGDTNSLHAISVYEITDVLSKDSVYYSTRTFNQSTFLGHTELVPKIKDSSVVGGINTAPQLRIALDTAFGGKLLREYIANPLTFASNESFLSFVKGIVLVDSANGNGSILTLEPSSTVNKLTLYFSGNKSYEFIMDANSARFSYFRHQYLFQNSDNIEDNPMVVQSMAGLKDSIVIPHLKNLFAQADKPVSINNAQLVFKVQESAIGGGLDPHASMIVFASDSLGNNTLVIDATESSSYFGGLYDSNRKEYIFNIGRHVQRILNGDVKDYGLFLVAGGSTSNAQRTVLQGGNSVKLIVTYTQVNL